MSSKQKELGVLDKATSDVNTIATNFVSGLDAASTAKIVSTANDIALVIDQKGTILDVTSELGVDTFDAAQSWVGKAWVDTVTVESRPKIESLIRTSKTRTPSRWRQVNLPGDEEADIPILFRVFSVDDKGRKIIMGRDLRALSVMQQELLDVQHSMENDYARLYQAETRYRMLFQLSSAAILIIDARGRNILEANPAASVFLDQPIKGLINSRFAKCFDEKSSEQISQLLANVRVTGKEQSTAARTRNGSDYSLHAAQLRQDDSNLFLIHLKETADKAASIQAPKPSSTVMDVIERCPDAFVVTDIDARILHANEAFMEMCQVTSDLQIKNQPLENWLGRPGVDVGVLRKNMQQRGVVRRYATQINPNFGVAVDVELSAVSAQQSDTPCLGFIIRRTLRKPKSGKAKAEQPLGRSIEQMTELVGRVPLKDLVRESTDLIERLCIDAALKITSNNRASAAEMLGLSRQSLYVKLRRFGIDKSDSSDKD